MSASVPLLTIAIPTYNRAARLDAQLEWATADIGAVWRECQVLVSDNASADGTPVVCAKWKARLGDQMTVFRHAKNAGAESNFRFCIRQAAGTYVWLVGDDDTVHDGAVQTVLGILRRHPDLGVLVLNFRTTDNYGGPVTKERVLPWMEDMYSFPGRELYQSCLQADENAMLLITAGVLRRETALQAIASWPAGVKNTAWHMYIKGYIALRSEMGVTGDTLLDYPLHSGNLRRWPVTAYYDIPEVYLNFIDMGYDAQVLRPLLLNRAIFLNFIRRFPLEFVKSLRIYRAAARIPK